MTWDTRPSPLLPGAALLGSRSCLPREPQPMLHERLQRPSLPVFGRRGRLSSVGDRALWEQ